MKTDLKQSGITKKDAFKFVQETYSAVPDYPWQKYPEYAVFRHANKKWFAVVLNVPDCKLGLKGDGNTDVLNVKCERALVDNFLSQNGILPAYHMNKDNWISILLNGTVDRVKAFALIDASYNLTLTKNKKRDDN